MTQPFPPDDEILSLFREWIVRQRVAQAISDLNPQDNTLQKAEYDAACDRFSELEGRIADIPSRGPIGLAVKCYLSLHGDHPGGYDSAPEMLGEFDAEQFPDTAIGLSILKDAVRFCPELAPLAAPALGNPAEAKAEAA
jgi:hypothetical protein